MARVLIADDRHEDRRLLRLIVESMGHEVVEASDGQQALERARAARPDLVLSDILMPHLDGFSLCRELQKDPLLRHVPFAFVTATYGEPKYRKFAEDVGAVKVLLKPYDVGQMRAEIDALLRGDDDFEATQRLRSLPDLDFHERHAEAVTSKLEEKVAELEQANRRLKATDAHIRGLLDSMIGTISKMVEYRDPYTVGHERRVGELAAAIAAEIGLDTHAIEGVRIGGALHDVGKVAAPAEILTKPTRLTAPEFEIIKVHSAVGHDILSGISFPWPIAEMVWQHHERMDGSGYPRGLKGEQIIVEARILAVADVVEAMSSHRPYRPGLGLEAALAEIERGRGMHYDEQVATACLDLFRSGRFAFS